MFEAISFCRQDNISQETPIDIGSLVECILFYESTTVIASEAILAQLIRYFGVERLIVLIDEDLLKIIYTESLVGIITNSNGLVQHHDAVGMTSPQHKYQDVLGKICIEATGRSGKGRRLAHKIQDKILVTKHDNIILEGARRSILDQDYVAAAAKIVIAELVPEIGSVSDILFHTVKTEEGILVDTNIDFPKLNERGPI